jgi:hypothetical protein
MRGTLSLLRCRQCHADQDDLGASLRSKALRGGVEFVVTHLSFVLAWLTWVGFSASALHQGCALAGVGGRSPER